MIAAVDFCAPALFELITSVREQARRVASAALGAASPDPEAIHDFRVALRRLRTLLRPARCLYGRRHLRAIGEELGRFARATGVLRDEEVLRETLSAIDLSAAARQAVTAWLSRRARHERARRRRVSALIAATIPGPGGPPLGEALAHLERRLGRRRPEIDAASFAEQSLDAAHAEVAALLHARTTDAPAMHALRIRYKRLRYTAELFAPLLGDRGATIAQKAARMQKRLGDLHDLDEALARIRRARSLPRVTQAAVTRALRRARARRSAGIRKDLAAERTPAPAAAAA
jgi:CHAD domain-containing protein